MNYPPGGVHLFCWARSLGGITQNLFTKILQLFCRSDSSHRNMEALLSFMSSNAPHLIRLYCRGQQLRNSQKCNFHVEILILTQKYEDGSARDTNQVCSRSYTEEGGHSIVTVRRVRGIICMHRGDSSWHPTL